tara:strand:+ start:279 stop:422 length:144 start_codon:yes stop_codon:yes gene_type:complete
MCEIINAMRECWREDPRGCIEDTIGGICLFAIIGMLLVFVPLLEGPF